MVARLLSKRSSAQSSTQDHRSDPYQSQLTQNSLQSSQTGTQGVSVRFESARIFQPLLKAARYKGAHGGRGGGKSIFFASLLVEEMLCQKTRAVCLREIQNSIKESVKQNIEDAIRDAGVGSLFTITDSEIRGPNNSLAI